MMTLYEKIMTLYPSLTDDNFVKPNSAIILQNDSDGNGDYIAKWEHPTLTRPTQAQLDGVTE
jgi:hypothetical protein